MALPLTSQNRSLVFLVLVFCVCVVVQVLGSPFTIVGQDVTTDVLKASLSEGFSISVIVPELKALSLLYLHEEFVPVTHLPVLPNSVFHPPPQA
ncbi:MAG: hypothetical protein JSR31_01505 [Nitrospira sp.]|nr:hypothetical protein [Nitrospira sp.]